MDFCVMRYLLRDLNLKQQFRLGGEDYVKLFIIGDLCHCSDSAGRILTFPVETEVFCYFDQLSLF